jgi:hypothetical protein
VHAEYEPESSRHSKVAPETSDENEKSAVDTLTLDAGADVMVVVGGVVSETRSVNDASVVDPQSSVARTVIV